MTLSYQEKNKKGSTDFVTVEPGKYFIRFRFKIYLQKLSLIRCIPIKKTKVDCRTLTNTKR
jgi:hypothetical protein